MFVFVREPLMSKLHTFVLSSLLSLISCGEGDSQDSPYTSPLSSPLDYLDCTVVSHPQSDFGHILHQEGGGEHHFSGVVVVGGEYHITEVGGGESKSSMIEGIVSD